VTRTVSLSGFPATWPAANAAKETAAEKVMADLRGGKGIGAGSLGFGKGVGNKALFLLTLGTQSG
jgi:hypothetical protein